MKHYKVDYSRKKEKTWESIVTTYFGFKGYPQNELKAAYDSC